MRTAVWHTPPEYGHFTPTLELARQLAQHQIRSIYLSEPDMQGYIEQAGFGYAPYLPDVYPPGALAARDRMTAAETWDWWFARDRAMWQEVVSGRLEAQLAALRPDVIFADQLNPDTSLVAHKLGVPVIRVSCMPPSYYEPGIPPLWSDALPGELSAWELEAEWLCHAALLQRKPWAQRENPIKTTEFYPYVESCGLEVAQINYRGAFNYHVESDFEVVTCARAFDFPKPDVRDRVYLGPGLAEVTGPRWTYPARRPDAPLIYCSFGSKGASYPAARRVIDRVIETARARPGLDVVLAVPDDVTAQLALPPTVHTLRWAPQREVLREAALFISHAGMSSVREALWEGVPLLAVPQAHDQRGVAARVVYHGVGERLIGSPPSAEGFTAAVDRLLGAPAYKAAAVRMQAAFRAEAADPAGLQFVLDAIDRRIAPRAPAYYAAIEQRLYRAIMGED